MGRHSVLGSLVLCMEPCEGLEHDGKTYARSGRWHGGSFVLLVIKHNSLDFFFFFWFNFFKNWCVCLCALVCEQGTYRGQTIARRIHVLPLEKGRTHGVRLGSKHTYLLSHLTGPLFPF